MSNHNYKGYKITIAMSLLATALLTACSVEGNTSTTVECAKEGKPISPIVNITHMQSKNPVEVIFDVERSNSAHFLESPFGDFLVQNMGPTYEVGGAPYGEPVARDVWLTPRLNDGGVTLYSASNPGAQIIDVYPRSANRNIRFCQDSKTGEWYMKLEFNPLAFLSRK